MGQKLGKLLDYTMQERFITYGVYLQGRSTLVPTVKGAQSESRGRSNSFRQT